jgi:RNA polymerase sigma factor (sigma-70 family)
MTDADRELYQRVLRICRRRWDGRQSWLTAEDIAQEAMLAVHTSATTRTGVELDRYVSGIVAHKVDDAYRLAYAQGRHELAADVLPDAATPDSASDRALALVGQGDLLAALGGLTKNQRTVLALRHLLDYSVDDTAELMATTAEAVRVTAYRGTAAARRLLKGADRG